MLQLHDLKAWYGNLQILHGVTLHVIQGEIVSIIGPNGAGKSTCLKAIANMVPKIEGEIFFEEKSMKKIPPSQLIQHGIGFIPQGRVVFPSLTVQENLELGLYTQKNVDREAIEKMYEKFTALQKRKREKAGLLSGGERLLLLDEPTLGLSPLMKKSIFEKIKEINTKEKVTILMVEQNARMALKLSDRAYVLELGKNRLAGTGEELLHNKEVEHLYLGGHG
ncbi:ABC transporter ATP-binding protein [Candidatus Woesearchaeota archaeon]|nr:ABC transporter ATP-binding protein [Candidatus Woesearchaeota archaeon]